MMPVYQKSLGDTVRKARHKAKLSQSELAEVLELAFAQSVISKIIVQT